MAVVRKEEKSKEVLPKRRIVFSKYREFALANKIISQNIN